MSAISQKEGNRILPEYDDEDKPEIGYSRKRRETVA
jgi:hypothetical protein